jgi:hypothetical protein
LAWLDGFRKDISAIRAHLEEIADALTERRR